MSTRINRRAILAGAASALPIIATIPADAGVNLDADLLELGTQLDPIIGEWLAVSRDDRRSQDEFEAMVNEATGIAFEDAPGYGEEDPTGYWEIRRAMPHQERHEHDEHGVDLVWKRIHDRMNPLVDAILSRRAQTVAGLAVQARAFTLMYPEWWDDEQICEPVPLAFVDAVCAFAGVTPVPLDGIAVQS